MWCVKGRMSCTSRVVQTRARVLSDSDVLLPHRYLSNVRLSRREDDLVVVGTARLLDCTHCRRNRFVTEGERADPISEQVPLIVICAQPSFLDLLREKVRAKINLR